MPETTESGGKASDLFLGVVDLFAVILPGALFTVTLWKAVSIGHKDLLLKLAPPEVIPKWLAFLLVSYILGHFLFAISSWIMDPLYDGYYKRKYEFEFKKELPSLRRRADRLLEARWAILFTVKMTIALPGGSRFFESATQPLRRNSTASKPTRNSSAVWRRLPF